MSFSLAQILLFIVAYLSGLFAVAYLADQGILPRRITRHPSVYVLSLGVFAGAMASNGSVALAHRFGYSFLLYYLGVVLMYVLIGLLMLPLLRLCRVYQLRSLADVLTFRFRSQWVGATVTLAMCITLLPLLALQIQAVANSIHILAGDSRYLLAAIDSQDGLAFMFCIIITVFSILFGTRHAAGKSRNDGLVTAIAFESLAKLAALAVLLVAAVYGVFDGPADMEAWLAGNPAVREVLDRPVHGDTLRAMLLIFFAGAVCMPHIFHMALAENTESQDLRSAAWGLPLFMLLLSLPILPVAWAGIKLGHTLPPDYSGLAIGLALESTTVSGAAFVAGMSAASATIIVTTLALANMCLNHLLLPMRILNVDREPGIYDRIKWLRRTLITGLILAGYAFYYVIGGRESLTQLALVAFIGTLQFMPGLVAALYWPGANRKGLLAGLLAGLVAWFFTLLLPILSDFEPHFLMYLYADSAGNSESNWAAATMLSMALNTGLFVLVSLLSRTSEDERVAAEICSMDDLTRPTRQSLALHSPAEFANNLAPALGEKTAAAEVRRALHELRFNQQESRPYALRRLRGRLEANLSGLFGPAVAHNIVNQCIPFRPDTHGSIEDINLIERNLDRSHLNFTGLAADLNNLRRHYRETLDNLPIGVCSVGSDGELLIWNRSMEQTTQIPAKQVLGSLLDSLPEPWRKVLGDFVLGNVAAVLKQEVTGGSQSRWVSLHKASVEDSTRSTNDRVILVEDITDYELMEQELLHSERLASIGQLAAGVAHEIGNPVTGIACLAQNLEYETDPEEIRNTAGEILKQTERVTRIVESLINFSHVGSRGGDVQLTPSNLADCIDEAVHLLELDHEAPPVQFDNRTDREMLVLADSQRLLQVFINLLTNARDACDSNGQVTVTADSAGLTAVIRIEDNGCGIEPEIQAKIFDPFFTTKDPGAGTGLGLALVYTIMEDMQGSVQLESPISEGKNPGTRFILELPLGNYGSEFNV